MCVGVHVFVCVKARDNKKYVCVHVCGYLRVQSLYLHMRVRPTCHKDVKITEAFFRTKTAALWSCGKQHNQGENK